MRPVASWNCLSLARPHLFAATRYCVFDFQLATDVEDAPRAKKFLCLTSHSRKPFLKGGMEVVEVSGCWTATSSSFGMSTCHYDRCTKIGPKIYSLTQNILNWDPTPYSRLRKR